MLAFQRAHHLDATGRADLETATAVLNPPVRALPPRPQDSNGRLPASELTGVGDGERIYTPAAHAFGADGRRGHGGRARPARRQRLPDDAEQASLYQAYRNGTGNLAAPPGHTRHGLGLSADIQVTDPATLRWLRAQAATYGFVNDVPSEAWHWTWRP